MLLVRAVRVLLSGSETVAVIIPLVFVSNELRSEIEIEPLSEISNSSSPVMSLDEKRVFK